MCVAMGVSAAVRARTNRKRGPAKGEMRMGAIGGTRTGGVVDGAPVLVDEALLEDVDAQGQGEIGRHGVDPREEVRDLDDEVLQVRCHCFGPLAVVCAVWVERRKGFASTPLTERERETQTHANAAITTHR